MDRNQVIPWKKRADLVVQVSTDRRGKMWVIKDPLTLQYFSMNETEFAVFSALDGTHSLKSLLGLLNDSSEQELPEEELAGFLHKLVGNNLVLASTIGYGKLVSERSARKRGNSAKMLSRLNLISFRWRGFDPQRFLTVLNRSLGWLYSPLMFVVCLMLFICAIIAVLGNSLRQESVHFNFQSIFTFQNLPILIISVILIKILHEIAHGLTCVHYGGECHELGILFIAFFPLLYCDTTDSWLHQSRWHRAQVAGAGMFVELVLASICCLLWVASTPGVLNTLFLNIAIVSSVNTLLINGNPLLRYDGYYLISDVLNSPNMGPESRNVAQSWLDRMIFGSPLSEETRFTLPNLPKAAYGFASSVYRLIVIVSIAWAIHRMFKNVGLEQLTWLALTPMILGILLSVSVGAVQRVRKLSSAKSQANRLRAGAGLLALIAACGIVISFPLPHTITAPFCLEPGLCRPIYVAVPGRMESIAREKTEVEQGDKIARLRNPDVERAISQTASEVTLRELQLRNLQTFRSSSALANLSIPAATQALEIARERFHAEQLRHSRLTITSPVSGTLFSPRNLPSKAESDQSLRFWAGQPQNVENLDAWMHEQTILGWVGSPKDFRAVAYVPQDQLEFILKDAEARIVFLSAPTHQCRGDVTEIGSETVSTLPREIVRNKLAAVDPIAGQFAPVGKLYRVQIRIDSGQPGTLFSTGIVKIQSQPRSIASRMWRLFCHTFAIEV